MNLLHRFRAFPALSEVFGKIRNYTYIEDTADSVLMTTQGLCASLTVINASLTIIRPLSAVFSMPQIYISENLISWSRGGRVPPILLQSRVPRYCFRVVHLLILNRKIYGLRRIFNFCLYPFFDFISLF